MVDKKIIVVTATYDRAHRIKYLERCAHVYKKVKNMIWIVVEDEKKINLKVNSLLGASGIEFKYLCFGPTRDNGNSQKNIAFEHIHAHKLAGVVYTADDDNYYDLRLFKEIRKTKRVSVFPVGNLPGGVARPRIENHRIIGWNARWIQRKYPVDWTAIAYDATVFNEIQKPFLKGYNWTEAVKKGLVDPNMNVKDKLFFLRQRKDGETEFLEKFVKSKDEFELLCRESKDCYVFHNLPLGKSTRLFNSLWNLRRIMRNITQALF